MTPTTVLDVFGARGETQVTAVIDTGFDGDICLPIRIAVSLGLELSSTANVELADGSRKVELVFRGSVRFLGLTHSVDILLTNGGDALVGTALLEDCRMVVDFARDRVQLTRKRKPSRQEPNLGK